MEFDKHVSQSLKFGMGRLPHAAPKLWWVVGYALLAVGLTQVHPLRQPLPRRGHAEQAVALQGDAAVRRLNAEGGYASLAAAMVAARYQIKAVTAQSGQASQPGPSFYANNPGQRLRATFASDEVRVSAALHKMDGDPEVAELRLKLAGYGYGDQLEPLAAGVLTAEGDRIKIKKPAIRARPGRHSAITEWYVKKPEGLEQGFTIAAPPPNSGRGECVCEALTV